MQNKLNNKFPKLSIILILSLFFNCLGAERNGFDSSGVDTSSPNFINTLVGVFLASLDRTPPSLSSANIKSNFTLETGVLIGTTSDNVAVSSVQVQVNSEGYNTATGTTSFRIVLPTTTKWLGGGNTVYIKVIDTSGNENVTTYTNVKKGENKDVNGDGYPDLVVSAPNYNVNQGRVYVFHGSSSGINTSDSSSANTILDSSLSTANFGSSLATGDINGDGFADLAVCSSSALKIDLYLGSSSGLSNSAVWSKVGSDEFCKWDGITISDFNRDGFEDIAISKVTNNPDEIEIYKGNSTGTVENTPSHTIIDSTGATTNTGLILRSIDLNNDGYPDLIATDSSGTNTTYIYLSSGSSGITTSFTGSYNQAIGSNGSPIIGFGDLNGDSKIDLIVGDTSSSGTCNIFLNNGSSTMPFNSSSSFTISGKVGETSKFCSTISSQDINNDGVDDLVIGAPDYNLNGKIYIFNGRTTWSSLTAETDSSFSITGEYSSYKFGYKVSIIDINGDNNPDLYLGEPGYIHSGNAAGKIYGYYNDGSGYSTGTYNSYSNVIIGDTSTSGGSFGSYLLR
ncbi:MAG: VCBS repeat-containing protein [Leptospiraceae bacterium]|nr:VCBS repeat-containing protein [Leptospiraceae bacterium]